MPQVAFTTLANGIMLYGFVLLVDVLELVELVVELLVELELVELLELDVADVLLVLLSVLGVKMCWNAFGSMRYCWSAST